MFALVTCVSSHVQQEQTRQEQTWIMFALVTCVSSLIQMPHCKHTLHPNGICTLSWIFCSLARVCSLAFVHNSLICETRLTLMWDMTDSYVRHDSLVCETWLTRMWDMTHPYVRHDSLVCAAWLTYLWDITQGTCMNTTTHLTDALSCKTKQDSL